jgi:hypothetical protein
LPKDNFSFPGHQGHCIDYRADIQLDGLDPGHSLIVRGVCLDDDYDRLWLMYSWVPGLTESMDGESGVALNVEFGADVMPDDRDWGGSYGTDGGISSDGEIVYARPPRHACFAWFDFGASDDPSVERRLARVKVDLVNGDFSVER